MMPQRGTFHSGDRLCLLSILSWASRGAQQIKNPPAMRRHRRCRFNPWIRKIPGRGNGKPLQYSCLENSMDRGAWQATVHRVAESDMPEYTHTVSSQTLSTSLQITIPPPPSTLWKVSKELRIQDLSSYSDTELCDLGEVSMSSLHLCSSLK